MEAIPSRREASPVEADLTLYRELAVLPAVHRAAA
jgi:hypothetical protein